MVLRRNVKYIQGVPRGVSNIQETVTIVMPSPLQSLTLTTGGIANATSLDPSARIDTWSRWTAVFSQFLVAKIVVISRLAKVGTTQGSIFVRVDEASSTPTSTIVRSERAQLDLALNQVEDEASSTIVWEPRSMEDVTWASTATGFTPAYLKTYADPTNTLTSAADSTTVVFHSLIYTLVFKYL